MKAATYKRKADSLIERLRKLTTANIPQQGNTSEECQRVFILNRLEGVQRAVNGVEASDMKPRT